MSRMKLRAAAAALAAALLAGCQGTVGSSPTPTPSAPPAALAAADAKLYSGDYEAAETAYRAAVQAGVPGSQAHLALLLDYESRFREAIAAAAAAVQSSPDSANLARLTRAYDWASDVPAALATGLRAVQATPVDPLAHAFYAEALSDAGRFDEAQAQLQAAESAAGDAYYRSEVYREWANYYRDRGDTASELNNMELSLRAQPRFPERSLELVRYDYVAKNPDAARSALQLVLGGATSGAVLAAGADAAFMAGDFDTASAYYQKALAASPSATEPELALALIAVAQKRDFKAAHDQARAALAARPGDDGLFEFLSNLDRYVLKIDPGADLNGLAPAEPALTGARQAALAAVGAIRDAAGLKPLTADGALDAAAEQHAWYTVFNLGQQSLAGLGVHVEDPSLPGYVAASAIARDQAAGYRGSGSYEVIDHVATPDGAVGVWKDSVYHRFPLLDPGSQAAGYGEVVVGPFAVSVMDVGLVAASGGQPVGYPVDGAKDVPTAFTGNEVPDPAPQGTDYPVGYPVTLQVGVGSALAITSAALSGPDSKPVASWILQPNQQVNGNEWCLLPRQPLKPGASYTVEVAGSVDGTAFRKRWTFTTAPPA